MSVKEEIWELMVDSRVSVTVFDYRDKPRTVTAKGKGSRIRITADDRERAEERIARNEFNPFRNGMLLHIEKDGTALPSAPGSDAMPDDDLAQLFDLDQEDFEEALKGVGEVNVRRLRDLGDGLNAGIGHMTVLTEFIKDEYSVGRSTKTYDELHGSD